MDAIRLQRTVNRAGDLALKIIHDDKSRCIFFKGFTGFVNIGYYDLLKVLDDC